MNRKTRLFIALFLLLSASLVFVSCAQKDCGAQAASSSFFEADPVEVLSKTTVGTRATTKTSNVEKENKAQSKTISETTTRTKSTTEKSKTTKEPSNISILKTTNNTHTNIRQILMRTEFNSYPSDVDHIKLFLECSDGEEFGFDARFCVEKKEGDGWRVLPFKTTATFHSVMQYAIPEPGELQVVTTTVVDARILQESISDGLYRISKIVDNQVVYAEFSVE